MEVSQSGDQIQVRKSAFSNSDQILFEFESPDEIYNFNFEILDDKDFESVCNFAAQKSKSFKILDYVFFWIFQFLQK